MLERHQNKSEFQKFYTYFYEVKNCISILKEKKISLNNNLILLEEDLALTIESLNAKDSLHDLRKETVKLAEKLYLSRLYEACLTILTAARQDSAELGQRKDILKNLDRIMNEIRSEHQYSFYRQDGFQNPYPRHLLFSQQYHNPNFSNKSGREYVQGKSVATMAKLIDSKEISADDLRISAYLAQFNGEVYLFAYNNRTWATFSRTHIQASRVVPILPTQELVNRIHHLETVNHNPNEIYQEISAESKEEQCTVSGRKIGIKALDTIRTCNFATQASSSTPALRL